MFESLTDRLSGAFRRLVGQGRLTEDNMQDTLKEVRSALLEADVALEVVTAFMERIKEAAIGVEIDKHLSSAQKLVKIVNDELVGVMGEAAVELDLKIQPPAIILMAGLQGSGKTTSVAKLAKFLTERMSKRVMLVSVDIYRPAAIEQLHTLAREIKVDCFEHGLLKSPVEMAQAALDAARKQFADVLIVDTAGRLHVDDEMMTEIQALHRALNPIETLFVVDGMTGQDAAISAKAFNEALPLTGVIVTKLDGDARGGAVLSIRHITGKPIKFVGMGEKVDALEPFYPDRIASRILGMGDILSLIEELERKVDKADAERLSKKITKGQGFDLEDFRGQLLQMMNMGGLASLMDKMPGMNALPQGIREKANDKVLKQMLAIIDSMTLKERRRPQVIKGSHKQRIASGSGTTIQDINRLLKQHEQMQKMFKKMSKKGGLQRMMRGLSGMLPPGGGGFPPH
ncbi:MAG: signal recognition particle protein [Gammaproteobacteria bacterium]